MSFIPRPYQAATEAAVNAFWAEGKAFPLVIAPTGAGKTEISKMILANHRAPMSIVHTRTLYEQTMRRVPDCRVYTLQGLLAKGPKADLRRANLLRHDVVWFDEAHHVGGLDWRRVLELPQLPKKRFGVTATPMRADGTALGDFFDCFHVAAKYSELVRDGYLVRCDVIRSDISRTNQKKQKVRPDGVAAYLEHGYKPPHVHQGDSKWRPGIHFEVTIEACEAANARYKEAGVRSELITNNTDTDARRRIFERYTAGELDMLCSPTVLAEGFDSPRAEVCVLRRSTDHVGDYLQRVGRVLRPFPGKERALLIDICNASTKRGHGLPTDDRVYSLAGKGIQLQAEVEEEEEVEPLPPPQPYEMVQSGHQMVRDTLLSRYRDYQSMAEEYGYKSGWVWHRFTEATSISPPRMFESQYQSVCAHCKHRCAKGGLIFWAGPQQVYHEECWFNALDGTKLEAASKALENPTPEWQPSRSRTPRTEPAIPTEDDLPF